MFTVERSVKILPILTGLYATICIHIIIFRSQILTEDRLAAEADKIGDGSQQFYATLCK